VPVPGSATGTAFGLVNSGKDSPGNLEQSERLDPVFHRFRTASPRLILLAGFGGLLVLMLLAGLYAVYDLGSIQGRNDAIRSHFVERNLLLNQIRGDLYLSGTYVRDYLLDPNSQQADHNRASLETTRRRIRANLNSYNSLLAPSEVRPMAVLTAELDRYWTTLDPVLQWSPFERQKRGYSFLRDDVFPRRTTMLNIADQIDHLNESQLTDGGRQVSKLFSDFRRSLGAALAVTLCLGLLLAAHSIRGVLELERQATQRFGEVVEARRELKHLSARLVETQEQERRSISRDLHDQVGQSLSALLVGLSNLWANVQNFGGAALRDDFMALRTLAEENVHIVRNMALLLRPSMLDDLGLVPALQWQAREVSRRTGIRVTVTAEQVSDQLPESHKTCVYRLVQEALHNGSRHAEPTSISVRVRQEVDCLRISIQDDGKGFRTDQEKGLGLIGMQERVATLGGLFEVNSELGRGTLILAALPLDRRDPTQQNHEEHN
jgi:signal transduction histidine kinase